MSVILRDILLEPINRTTAMKEKYTELKINTFQDSSPLMK